MADVIEGVDGIQIEVKLDPVSKLIEAFRQLRKSEEGLPRITIATAATDQCGQSAQ